MITIELDFNSEKTLYEQLYFFFKNEILSGNLKAGEKLPSKRNLAKNLGISVITVETAYSQLCAEGFIESVPHSGFFVSDSLSALNDWTHSENENFSIEEICMENEKKSVNYEYDFSSNQTDVSKFPFSIWAKLVREVLSSNQKELLENPPAKGSFSLRLAIAKHLHDFRGMNVNPKRIVIGAGTEYLYGLLIQLLGFDLSYGIENPSYGKIQKIYESFGVKCRKITMDREGIILSDLDENNIDVIHISPSHQFPTGIVMPFSRRIDLLHWAETAKKHYIIEDDYDSEFRFSGKPIPPLQSLDKNGKVIYMNTFTKTLSSTIRISYMVLPDELSRKFEERLNFYSCTVPTIEQFTLEKFISLGFFERHINRARKNYHLRRDLIINSIEKFDSEKKIQVLEEDSGLHFLIKLSEKINLSDFNEKMKKERIRIQPLSIYYENPPLDSERIFIVNYSGIPEEKIEFMVRKIIE